VLVAAATAMPTTEASAFVWPNVPERIARGLSSSDPAERRTAASQLGDLPPPLAKPLVLRAMGDEDVEVRISAARTAARFKIEGAGDLVVPWLSETDSRLRLAACEVVRAVPTDRSITALGRVLSDPSQDVRLAAASAMGRSGSREAATLLLGHLDDNAPEVRSEVAQALGRLADKRAALPLVGRVQDASADVRRRVARALGDIGDPRATSALVLALNDASIDVRVEAALALGRMGTDEATVSLAPLVRGDATSGASSAEGTQALRQAALRALGRIGTPRAIDLLVASLESDRPDALRSPARDALASIGSKAVPALTAVISGAPSPKVATGAVSALGEIGDPKSVAAIVRGTQRGTVPVLAGLTALATLGSDAALPAVLELMSDQPSDVRRAAIETASILLDPSHPDGRAIDPVKEILADSGISIDERIALASLLGRTGSPRAVPLLLTLAKDKSVPLRRAALAALGSISQGDAAIDGALTKGLDDEIPTIRMDAAIALSKVGTPAVSSALLHRLVDAAEQDRGALGIALSGTLSRSREPELANQVTAAVKSAPVESRDALIEGLGRMGTIDALTGLTSLAAGPLDDRRKVAEALAAQGKAASTLLGVLAKDGDGAVRASAAWSLGFAGDASSGDLLGTLLGDADVTVAGNAAASLGRIAARAGDPTIATSRVCAALTDGRAHVRANALAGLDLAGADCGEATAVKLLASDPSEIVRLAAARHLHRWVARTDTATPAPPKDGADRDAKPKADAPKTDAAAIPKADGEVRGDLVPDKTPPLPGVLARRALSRCVNEETTYRVARACERAPVAGKPGAFPLVIFVVPDGASQPTPRAPFTVVLPDGTMHMGNADRRGAVFESAVPSGDVELGVPAPLATVSTP